MQSINKLILRFLTPTFQGEGEKKKKITDKKKANKQREET